MLSLKCDHPFGCEFSIIFSTVKLNVAFYEITSQFFHRFKILSPIHKRDGRLHFQIFPNSLKSLKIEIFVPLPSYLSNGEDGLALRCVASERKTQLLMIRLAVFKKIVNIIMQNVRGTQLCLCLRSENTVSKHK